jgi:hypothetical protein
MFAEYYASLEKVKDELFMNKDTFIGTFAPEGGNLEDVVALLSSFVQIPYGVGVGRVLGSSKS